MSTWGSPPFPAPISDGGAMRTGRGADPGVGAELARLVAAPPASTSAPATRQAALQSERADLLTVVPAGAIRDVYVPHIGDRIPVTCTLQWACP